MSMNLFLSSNLRLPGGIHTPDAFWEKISQGFDGVGTIPPSRWSIDEYFDPDPDTPGKTYSRHGAFLDDVASFDADFFGISPKEAKTMDPQQRLLLEVAWEAIENAGIAPSSLWGSSTGVYLGIATGDYSRKLFAAQKNIDPYFATGSSYSVAAGRLSYFLSLKGPSIAVDTACSASLVAVHLACQSLRNGESSLALAGGVNLILSPDLHINFSKSRMLSKSGRCRTFDRDADGYVRGEGCGFVVLKSLERAQADGDPVLAVIQGSAINQDGRSGGLTAPNGPSQEAVIKAALQDSGIAPLSVNYVEAHGTGTSLGDPIEIGALARVYSQGRSQKTPLWVGSVKTNFGHLEAAAGITGLIKATMMLKKGKIPPNLHFKHPNPHISWSDYSLKIATEELPWPANGENIAGVSSFGFSGTNAHILLRGLPVEHRVAATVREKELLCLSAKSEAALKEMTVLWRDKLTTAPQSDWQRICATAAMGRSHFEHRIALSADSPEQAAAALDTFGDANISAQIAFLYPHTGNYDSGAGCHFYEQHPAFRTAVNQCSKILTPLLGQLLEELFSDVSTFASATYNKECITVAEFVTEYALTELLRTWGISPDLVMGRGHGEFMAAVTAGVMTLEDALKLLLEQERGNPGTNQSTQNYTNLCESINLNEADIDMISAHTGKPAVPGELVRSDYWQRPGEPALQSDAELSRLLSEQNMTLMVIIGPEDLAAEIKSIDKPKNHTAQIGLLLGNADPRSQILHCLGMLYTKGATITWPTVFGKSKLPVSQTLPTYPFQRQHFWFEPEPQEPAVSKDDQWDRIVESARHQSSFLPADLAPHGYPEKWRALDTITEAFIQNCLQEIGLFQRSNESHSLESLMNAGQINSRYAHMIERWLMHLVKNGSLQATDESEYLSGSPLARKDIDELIAETKPLFEDIPFLLNYVTRCGQKLSLVVTGKESALETLFPGGSFDIARDLYSDWSLARYFNAILRCAFKEATAGGPVHVLEIGAGTGGTTEALLKTFPQYSSYLFTDLSDFFLDKARQQYQSFPGFCTAILDIEESPELQGIQEQTFDIIIASNVLHATKDLDRTMTNVYRLLAPGGILLLYETTRHPKWFDITTGLIEGWQIFSDSYRSSVPLTDSETWRKLLDKNKFIDIHILPEDSLCPGVFFQHAIIARTRPGKQPIDYHDRAINIEQSAPLNSENKKEEVINTSSDNALSNELAAKTPDERRELCRAFVSRQLGEVMHKAPGTHFNINHRLIDLGVDSLMALELRNRLARGLELASEDIPATLVFDYPTIAAVADVLLEMKNLMRSTDDDEGTASTSVSEAEITESMQIPTPDEDEAGDDIKRLLLEKLNMLDNADTDAADE